MREVFHKLILFIINRTKSITEYTFHCTNLPYTLTIIDTSSSVDLVIQEELKEIN